MLPRVWGLKAVSAYWLLSGWIPSIEFGEPQARKRGAIGQTRTQLSAFESGRASSQVSYDTRIAGTLLAICESSRSSPDYEESFKPGRLPHKRNLGKLNDRRIVIAPPQEGHVNRRETAGVASAVSCGMAPISIRQIGRRRARVLRDRKPKKRMRTNPRGST